MLSYLYDPRTVVFKHCLQANFQTSGTTARADVCQFYLFNKMSQQYKFNKIWRFLSKKLLCYEKSYQEQVKKYFQVIINTINHTKMGTTRIFNSDSMWTKKVFLLSFLLNSKLIRLIYLDYPHVSLVINLTMGTAPPSISFGGPSTISFY